jgi:signal transduction histidine kinase
MPKSASSARLNQYFRISRLLAGQLDFQSAIQAVATEIAQIIPHDHLDVCIVGLDGRFHTAYETGIETRWGSMPHAAIADSPIRALLMGEVDHILTDDACNDLRFSPDAVSHKPIFDHELRSRIHLPMLVHGQVIGALSCSTHRRGRYGVADIRNGRYVAELLSPYFFALRAADQARKSAVVEVEARAREEGLRQGALQLTEALEGERQRIGMDLHDQTLADLTRLTRRVERLSQAEAVGPADLALVSEGLHGAMNALRQIIEAATPSVFHLFGFSQAVENHLDRAVRESGLAVRARLEDATGGAVDGLAPSVGVALFRITQEAVNNAVNHAQASEVLVTMDKAKGQIVISVQDNGRGVGGHRSGEGRGIENMTTRARLIGARFGLSDGPKGRGTKVVISLSAPDASPRQAKVAARWKS